MNKDTANSQNDLPQVLDDAARKLVSLRLHTPTLFFLEAHRPLSGILYNLTLFSQPFLSPVFGSHRVHLLQRLLEDPKVLDLFIQRLESYSLAEFGEKSSL